MQGRRYEGVQIPSRPHHYTLRKLLYSEDRGIEALKPSRGILIQVGIMDGEHRLHIAVRKTLKEVEARYESLTFRYDTACRGSGESEHLHQLPLFVEEEKSLVTKYCQVDALALKTVDGEPEVVLIIEIEETGISQIKILGKVLASAMCRFYIHDAEGGKPIPISRDALFIQVIRERNEGKHKREKWDDIKERVRGVLPVKRSRIRYYSLIHGSLSDFEEGGGGAVTLRREIESHLAREKRQ